MAFPGSEARKIPKTTLCVHKMLLRLLGQTGEKTAAAAVVAAVAVGVVSGDCGKWSSCVCLLSDGGGSLPTGSS